MPVRQLNKRWFLLSLFLLLVIACGCTVSNTDGADIQLTPLPTTIDPFPGERPFIDTGTNIHLFQNFDYQVQDPASIAKYYDFVWGADPTKVAAFRAGNPNIFLSYYLSFFRDTGTFLNQDAHHDLKYWKATHPDWILYQCDRRTPAYEDNQTNVVPFDFSNPDLITWQMQTYALPASQQGYDAIAADNLNMENLIGACGSYKNGQWVQRYSGKSDDPQWRADVLTWVARMQIALHALQHPLALVPNLSLGFLSPDDPIVQQVMGHIDGVLDEGGFTNYSHGYLTDEKWIQTVQFIKNVQKQHKSYYVVNEFPSVDQNEIQWALASYLMCNEHASSISIVRRQEYGKDLRYPEYGAQIGSPTDEMYQGQGVYWRDYTHGLSLVNPSSTQTYSVKLPGQYTGLYGNTVGQMITLPPHSGVVLLF
ncbi:MAG TPA: putative glycoside hydrolase [Ktedonobacteraceae bacterium]|jgi:putative glycosyl hydrolase-like family 15 (GHL15) protein|nr:putative glycoside hydrolase [Ktedonobacteraceae bacterium]